MVWFGLVLVWSGDIAAAVLIAGVLLLFALSGWFLQTTRAFYIELSQPPCQFEHQGSAENKRDRRDGGFIPDVEMNMIPLSQSPRPSAPNLTISQPDQPAAHYSETPSHLVNDTDIKNAAPPSYDEAMALGKNN